MTGVLIYFDKKNTPQTHIYIDAIKEAAHSRCDDIYILDGYTLADTDRLSMYGYIAVFCADKSFFSSAYDPKILTILKEHGLKGGSKGCVLTLGKGLFSGKFARNVMNGLESCGFIIDYFNILKNTADAVRAGENIG